MEYLFDGLSLDVGCKFQQPTVNQINGWLKSTGGRYTREIYVHLGKIPSNDIPSYTYLTGAQQWWIICELNG